MLHNPPSPHQVSPPPPTPCQTPSRRTSSHGHQFAPTRSSPLSPRTFHSSPLFSSSSLHQPQPSIFSLTTTTTTTTNFPSPPRSPQNAPAFMNPRRLFKPSPLLQRTREDTRTARREFFLKKVQNGRLDKTMAARGGEDEMMRMVYVAEQKRWERNLERAAPRIETDEEQYEVEEEVDEVDPVLVLGELDVEELERLARLAETGDVQGDEFDEYLDMDGAGLEELLSQMDLDVEMN